VNKHSRLYLSTLNLPTDLHSQWSVGQLLFIICSMPIIMVNADTKNHRYIEKFDMYLTDTIRYNISVSTIDSSIYRHSSRQKSPKRSRNSYEMAAKNGPLRYVYRNNVLTSQYVAYLTLSSIYPPTPHWLSGILWGQPIRFFCSTVLH